MSNTPNLKNRLVSLDFFRGLVMFFLIAEFAHLFEVLMESGNEQLTAVMDFMFHHAKWEGLHFWDLVQPFFMFMLLSHLVYFSYSSNFIYRKFNKQV